MSAFIQYIKDYIKNFIKNCSTAEPIEGENDYIRVKKWVKKVSKLYLIFTIIAIVVSFLLFGFAQKLEIPLFLVCTLFPFLILLTCWGYATLILYFPSVFKSVVKWGSEGYKAGEKMETRHVQVTHEYGNQYRVSSYTENKGCLFAIIAGTARFMVWAFFCVYVGPFLNFKKLKNSIKNLCAYSQENV